MPSSLTIKDFHQLYQKRLQLSFISSQVGLENSLRLSSKKIHKVADFLNIIRPSSIVIIGNQESQYLAALREEQQHQIISSLFDGPLCAIILSQNAKLIPSAIKYCASNSVPVMQSQLPSSKLLEDIQYFLNQNLAETTTEHGVFLDVFSIGIFLTGESGVGKSELALSLISRGHRLIADDITEFSRTSVETVDGIHPGITNEFMEVRGLGILNIQTMFGTNALRRNKSLRLIVNLVPFTKENSHQFDRLGNNTKTRSILGLEIPQITLPVAPGRNLTVLIEAAARNHLQYISGYSAAEDFIERQRIAIKANSIKQSSES